MSSILVRIMTEPPSEDRSGKSENYLKIIRSIAAVQEKSKRSYTCISQFLQFKYLQRHVTLSKKKLFNTFYPIRPLYIFKSVLFCDILNYCSLKKNKKNKKNHIIEDVEKVYATSGALCHCTNRPLLACEWFVSYGLRPQSRCSRFLAFFGKHYRNEDSLVLSPFWQKHRSLEN